MSPPNKTNKILADHRRIGKRYVPPFFELGPLEEISWAEVILPELIWLPLLIEAHGMHRSAHLISMISKVVLKHCATPPKPWLGAISAFKLDADILSRTRDSLAESRFLDDIAIPIRPLILLYPECPLSFLVGNSVDKTGDATSDAIGRMKTIVENMLDRKGQTATFAQAHGVYIAFISGLLKVAAGLSLAHFPEVEHYPNSEISIQVAASVRATTTSLIGLKCTNRSWPIYFWNRGIEVSSCAVRGQDNG